MISTLKKIGLVSLILSATVATAMPAQASYLEGYVDALIDVQNSRSSGVWGYLRANDALARINIREYPSTGARSYHYGLVGDRVWVTEYAVSGGYYWYYVGFPDSGVTGWVRGDLIRF